jgi:hypothetical protein
VPETPNILPAHLTAEASEEEILEVEFPEQLVPPHAAPGLSASKALVPPAAPGLSASKALVPPAAPGLSAPKALVPPAAPVTAAPMKAPLRVRRTDAEAEEPVPSATGPVPEGGCPSCGKPLDAEAVLCIRCGYDLRSGKKIKTQIEAGPSRVGGKPASRSVKDSDDYAHLVLPPLMLVLSVGMVLVGILSAKSLISKGDAEKDTEVIQRALDYRQKRKELEANYRDYLIGRPQINLVLPVELSQPVPLLVILGSSELPASALPKLVPTECAVLRLDAPGEGLDRAWSEEWESDGFIVDREIKRLLAQKKFKVGAVILGGLGQGGAAALEIAARDPQTYSGAVAADPVSLRPMLDDIDKMDHKKQRMAILESPQSKSLAAVYRSSAADELGLKIPETKLEKGADAASLRDAALKLLNRK